MFDKLTALFEDGLPEIKTDIGTDIDTAIKANTGRLALIIFIAFLLAFVLGSVITKKLIK